MEIPPIKTEQDYNSALSRIEELCRAKKSHDEGDERDILVTPSSCLLHHQILIDKY